MKPDPEKIQGITNITPQMYTSLSFLGMLNFMKPYISHHTLQPKELLNKKYFTGMIHMDTAFQELKTLISKAHNTLLLYYQRDLPVIIQADATKHGLGAFLFQNGKPMTFALKSLTDAETLYDSIERQLLAVIQHVRASIHTFIGTASWKKLTTNLWR